MYHIFGKVGLFRILRPISSPATTPAMNLADIPIGDEAPAIVPAVIEIPKKSRTKFIYDLTLQLFRLKRVLHSAVQYPAAYGFVPQTLWDDDEPLDIIVLSDEPFTPGVLVRTRPVGLLLIQDDDELDSKVLAVPVGDPRFADITEITHVSAHLLREIEHFFESYKQLEGTHVRSFGWNPATFAHQAITRGMRAYTEHHAWISSED
jgi:inorganic pyrophosphatase